MKFSTTLLAALAAGQQVAANGWNVNAKSYRSPANLDNQCSDAQKSGYDFEDLDVNKSVGSYGGNSFTGFSCNSSKLKKRDGSSSKCISGSISNKSGPSFGGASGGNSVKGMHISSDEDTEVECHYQMPSGDVCKQTVQCKAGGTQVQNNQCGGAVQVSFKQPDHATKSCGLNIHSISFDCSSKSSTVPPSSYATPTAETTGPPTTSVAASATPFQTTPTRAGSTTTSVASTSLSSYTQPGSSSSPSALTTSTAASVASPPVINFPSTSSSNVTTTTLSIATSPSADVQSSTSSTADSYSSASLSAYVPSSSSSTADSISSSTQSTNSTGPTTAIPVATSSSPASSSSSAAPPPPAAQCPDIVQSCLNTWMWESGCSNNAQADCYCRNAQFIAHVHECIGSWGSDCQAKSIAASYLVGICGKHIQDNSALIGALPSCACLGGSGSGVSSTSSTGSTASPSSAALSVPTPVNAYASASISPAISASAPTSANAYANITTTSVAAAVSSAPASATPSAAQPLITNCPVTQIPYSTVITTSSDSTPLVTTIVTTITVPQVSFSTIPGSSSGAPPSYGLYPPATTPASNSATATPTGTGAVSNPSGVIPGSGADSAGTTLASSGPASAATSLPTTVRTATQTATATTSGVLRATGAASGKVGISFVAAGAGVLALLL